MTSIHILNITVRLRRCVNVLVTWRLFVWVHIYPLTRRNDVTGFPMRAHPERNMWICEHHLTPIHLSIFWKQVDLLAASLLTIRRRLPNAAVVGAAAIDTVRQGDVTVIGHLGRGSRWNMGEKEQGEDNCVTRAGKVNVLHRSKPVENISCTIFCSYLDCALSGLPIAQARGGPPLYNWIRAHKGGGCSRTSRYNFRFIRLI
jgi:hypothetical protein